MGDGIVRPAGHGGFLFHCFQKAEQMKFLVLVALTTLGSILLVHTLEPPLMTQAVRAPLSVLILLLALVTPLLERWLRPSEGGRPGAHINKVMGMTLIKMFLMLGVILAYLVSGQPDPKVFGVSAYLVYLAFTGLLVSESMRHGVPPTDPR